MIKIDSETPGARTIRLFPWIARVAAAIILVIGFTFLFYQYQDLSPNDLNLQTMVQTNESDQKVVELPDGSTVWLNRNSELLYPEVFDGATRPIYLKGEAFFEVTSNKDKPFIIHSGISKTSVLGTSFNLRAYYEEDEVKLSVVTGKVAFTLADEKEGVIVTPGDMAILNNQNKSIAQNKNLDINFLSWKTNYLTFNDSPISELIASLERHYAVQIDVENPETLSCRFTGDFQNTELENVIKIIARATGSTYEFIEGHYIIQGTGCN
jgi:ferric-dicitrate binding protein FerR (iron transport regulator)